MSNDEIMDLNKLETVLEDEVSSEEIQELDEDFYEKALDELHKISSEKEKNPLMDKKEEVFRNYLSEILRTRIIKILSDLQSGNSENLTLAEDKVFNYLRYLIGGSKNGPKLHEIVEKEIEEDSSLETVEEVEKSEKSVTSSVDNEQGSEVEETESVYEETGKKEEINSEIGSEESNLTRGSSPVEESSELESVGYLLLEDTPEMMDTESSNFGPFSKGDLVSLPADLGDVLVEREVAEKLNLDGLEGD